MERFEKIKELGRGATGTVFKSFDNESGKLVALKTPEPHVEGIDVATHYQREIDMLATLKHDGIVKIVAQRIGNGTPWIAYEFLKGHTLRELITSGKEFEPEDAVRITAEIARALDYIHNSGIVHRDINPNNIMITTDGAVKIMDFGIAHRAGEPFPKQLAGTPGYMSPETARGEEGSAESDIYSLGLVCHELIANSPVYSGDSVPEVIAKVVANDFISLEKKKPELDDSIYQTVGRALEKNPQDRFSSAHEFSIALEKIISVPMDSGKSDDISKPEISAPPKLIGLAGPYKGYELDMGATIMTFGGEYADVDLSHDAAIASQHCWIVPEDGAFWIYDAEDSGGTFIGGRAIKRARLKPGDRITIGTCTFRWDNSSDMSPPSRDHGEIEYAATTQPIPRTKRRMPPTDNSAYPKAPSAEMSPFARMLLGTVIAVIVIYLFHGYALVPRAETKQIALELENYWVDFKPLMTSNDPSVNIQLIEQREDELSYNTLESTELVSSFFFNLPGPKNIRENNLKKIEITIKACQALNYIRSEITTSEKKVQVESLVGSLESIELPKSDTWEDRRLWLVSKLTQIETQLALDAVRETELGTSMISASGATDAALEKLLDGYYLIEESPGTISTVIAEQAYDNFSQARDSANIILEDSPTDNMAEIIVILSDYFIVRLRVDKITEWRSEIIDDSSFLLLEGQNTLERMSNSDFVSNMPAQIENNEYRVRGRLRAKYITLIDEFEQKTGANVGGS